MRYWLALLVCGAPAVLLGACSREPDTEPFNPAEPGAVQPEGNGDRIDEAEACRSLSAALEEAHADLDCDGPQPASCPELIRPFGSDPCERYAYDEGSIEACVERIEGYDRCSDFDEMPCIATAEERRDADCGAGGEGGAASGGSGGGGATTGGSGGSPEGGAAGAAGAP